MSKVFIVSAVRTPIGSFGGSLSKVSATKLGAVATKGALEKGKVQPEWINEVFMGNVLQANTGQAPARQAALYAGIPSNTPCTTVNKVCASGMKSVMLAAQSIKAGDQELIIAGGMENMSAVPYYSENLRFGNKLGDVKLIDGLVKDGLTDAFHQTHMGVSGELCAEKYKISREEQDQYAVQSYERSQKAWKSKAFNNEIIGVSVPQRKGDDLMILEDEEYTNVNMEKIPLLKPVFKKEGTITAANASTLNDGASALIIASEKAVKKYNLSPIAEIISYADAANEPEWFTTAPAKAIPKAIDLAHLKQDEIDLFEINEAFSVVALANLKLLKLNPDKVNIYGGAVSLGHPLGCSGARILTTLVHALHSQNKTYGVAGICNGGGGASAMVIKKFN